MKKIYMLAMGLAALVLTKAQVSDLGSDAQVTDISNTGVAVGNVAGVAFFMWSEAESGSILGEGGPNGVPGNAGISADGSVVVMSLMNPATNREEAVLYKVEDQSMNFLGDLGFSADNAASAAWGISSNGKNVAGFAWRNYSVGEAVVWKDGTGIIGLGSSVEDRNSRADAVNADGTVVAGWQDSDLGLRQGAIWKNGEQQLLKDNGGNILGPASSISADGKTVCGTSYTTGQGYIWHETDGTTLIKSENPTYITSVVSLSDDGNTAVGFSYDPMEGMAMSEGFIWTKEDGKKNLNDYVSTLGYDNHDIVFAVPTGISPDGKYIGGMGTNFTEMEMKGFLIKLPGAGLATQETSIAAAIAVYPNPVVDIVTVKTLEKIETAEVYNAVGQLVLTPKNIPGNKLDLSSLAKGNYVLKVKTAQGTQTAKLLKK